MAGYAWKPQVRITPPDGNATVIDLRAALVTVAGAGPQSIGIVYKLDRTERTTINRRLRSVTYGLRPELTFSFVDGGAMNDSDIVAQIVTALLDDEQVVEVTLDGVTWREIEISGDLKMTPNGGKTAAGVTWTLTASTRDLVQYVEPLRQGSW